MKKDDIRQWLQGYLLVQQRVTLGSAIAMGALAFFGTLLEWLLLWAILRLGFIGSSGMARLVALGILAAAQWYAWSQLKRQLPDSRHTVDVQGDEVKISIPPSLTAVWTYALGSTDIDLSRIERLINLLTVPQRMGCAAWYTWCRRQQLRLINPEISARVIRLLHKKAERIDVGELAHECDLQDVPQAIRDVSLVDGVVLLTRGQLGMSLANRLLDALAAWKSKRSTGDGGESE
jgi:hypothetical protein